MKLFDKLKDILFDEDEEEVETQVTPKKVVTPVKEEEVKPIQKVVVEEEESTITSAPTVNENLDNTFKFPLFDEKEFENTRPSRLDLYEKKERANTNTNLGNHDVVKNEPKNNVKYSARDYEKFLNEPKEEKKTKFKPSPNISPVYGILDKNYKLEDYQPIVKEVKPENKTISVEDVRKKAFGTLNKDLEETLNKSLQDFYEETKVVEETIKAEEKEDSFKTTDLKETLNDIKDNLSDLTNAMNNLGDKVDNKSKDIDEELDKPRSAMELLNEIESELDEITKNKEVEENNIDVELDIKEDEIKEDIPVEEEFEETKVDETVLDNTVDLEKIASSEEINPDDIAPAIDDIEIDLSSYNEQEENTTSDNDELFNLIDAMYDVEDTDKDSE